MLYYEDILFSLYEIKEYAELMNKYVKDENISSGNVQNFTSRIIEHAKAAIGEVKSRMTVEDLGIKKASRKFSVERTQVKRRKKYDNWNNG